MYMVFTKFIVREVNKSVIESVHFEAYIIHLFLSWRTSKTAAGRQEVGAGRWGGRKNSLGRKLMLYSGRLEKGGWWEMGDTVVGDGRQYPLSTPSF